VSPTASVHVLRHGEVHNPEGILYGRLPGYRLSALGEQMAKAAAAALAGRQVVHVASSPMERARQTAEPVAEGFGIGVHVDDRLLESTNFFEGKQVGVGDGAFRWPRYWHKLYDPFTPSWGEPYRQIAERMHAALLAARNVVESHRDGNEAVLVSHQLPIWTLRRYVEGRRLWHDPRRRQCALASLTTFHFDGDTISSVTYTEPAADLTARSSHPEERGA
jgi:broad specificity phosphatase PhoE